MTIHARSLAMVAVLAACGPGANAPADAAATPAAADAASIRPEVATVDGHDVHVFGFSLASARFDVVDAAMTADIEGALARAGASLAVNGGFFDAQQRPEGLVVVGGRTLAPLVPALGGGVLVVADGRASLHAAEGFALAPGAAFAVQARPRLVVDGAGNVRGDGGPQAERTALCVRDGGQRMEVIVVRGAQPGQGPTLGQLAALLVARGCEQALNLDGGPSTGVAWREDGRVRVLPPRGPIRHAFTVRLD